MYHRLTTHSITKLVVDLIQWHSTYAQRLKEGQKCSSEGSLTFYKKRLTVYKLEPINKAKIKETCFVSFRQRKVMISFKHGNEPWVQ
jgi:hypothetical protein